MTISSSSIRKQTQAIIIGGSLAGLLTARVLADYFDQVLILERDHLPAEPVARKGVPQSNQWHSVMARGYHILEAFYPGFSESLQMHNVPLADIFADTIMYSTDRVGYVPRWYSGILTPACSRTFLEWQLRQRTLTIPNVRVQTSCRVLGLVLDGPGKQVTGVKVFGGGEEEPVNGRCQILNADLVVDASGRHSKLPQWLTAGGYAIPPETVVDAQISYVSRYYHAPAHFTGDWRSLVVAMQYPDNPRAGALRRIENDLWQVMFVGIVGEKPPVTEEGFLAFAQQLASPILYEAIRTLEPASPPFAFGNNASRRRHLEATAVPERLLVIGDAACCFNPFYGQGLTSIALCAEMLHQTLGQHLRRHPNLDGYGAVYYRQLAKTIDNMWEMATYMDNLWIVPHKNNFWVSLRRKIRHQIGFELIPILLEEKELYIKTIEVQHQLRPFRSMFTPYLVCKVLWYAFNPFMQREVKPVRVQHPDLGLMPYPLPHSTT